MTVERIKIDAKRKNEKKRKKKDCTGNARKKNLRKCQQIGTKPPNLLTSV